MGKDKIIMLKNIDFLKIKHLIFAIFSFISAYLYLKVTNDIFAVIFIFLAIIIFAFLLLNKKWIIYGIILTLFLEGHKFSFYLFGARIRIIQVIEVMGIFYIVLSFLLGKYRIRKTPLDLPLWSYLGVNFLAITNAVWFTRSVKISVLLLSLALLCYLVYSIITTKEIFDKSFKLLLYIGVVEIIYGIYQVVAGMLNYYLGTNLSIGYLGIVHTDFIGSPWGRPYGTFVEPDWYGIICMFYALVFMYIYYSKVKIRKSFYLGGFILSLIGLFFSFVRSAWVGFIFGCLFFLANKYRHRIKINFSIFVRDTLVFIVFCITVVLLSPSLQNVIKERFFTKYVGAAFSFENVRVQQIITSLEAFLRKPILGNGPGSSAFNYFKKTTGKEIISREDMNSPELAGFNPSLIITVLEDTGLIGLFLFFVLIFKIVRLYYRQVRLLDQRYSVIATALFGGLIGLFISYFFTSGFWLPFTWVFLAFSISVLKIGKTTGIENCYVEQK